MLFMRIIFLLIMIPMCYGREQRWADSTLKKMSLEEKIGQLIMPAVPCNPQAVTNFDRLFTLKLPTDLNQDYAERMMRDYHVGGFLLICEGEMPDQVASVNYLQSQSKVPLLITQDLESGLVRLKDAIKFCRNMTLGAIGDNRLLYQLGLYLGKQAKRLGVHIILGPVVDVNNNPRNPVISDRSFGEDPAVVAKKGIAFMQGVQDAGVIPCAKHFPGHGDTDIDSHVALPRIPHSMRHLHEVELVPFKALITAGVQSIMTAHLMVPAVDSEYPTSLSYKTVHTLLTKELGFKGLVLTDGMIMKALTDNFGDGQAALQAFLAGSHILVFPADVPRACERIKQAILDGIISLQELDARVLKILQIKEKLGLDQCRYVQEDSVVQDIVTKEAIDLKKELYRQAITEVKNDNALPLLHDQKIALVQIGGTQVNSFVQQLQHAAGVTHLYVPSSAPSSTFELLAKTLRAYKKVIIAVLDMNKFSAQRWGISDQALTFIHDISENHSVNLVIFGSPYSLQLFGNQSSIMVAYEDDPDAHVAAAQVMLGHLKPLGKLPVNIERVI